MSILAYSDTINNDVQYGISETTVMSMIMVGDIISCISTGGVDGQHIKIVYSDPDVINFFNSYGSSKKSLYVIDTVDWHMSYISGPYIVEICYSPKDWYGNLINNSCEVKIQMSFVDSFEGPSYLEDVVKSWIRDRKIRGLID